MDGNGKCGSRESGIAGSQGRHPEGEHALAES